MCLLQEGNDVNQQAIINKYLKTNEWCESLERYDIALIGKASFRCKDKAVREHAISSEC